MMRRCCLCHVYDDDDGDDGDAFCEFVLVLGLLHFTIHHVHYSVLQQFVKC